MIRAALTALLFALLLASGAAFAAPAEPGPGEPIEATSRRAASRKPAVPPLNTFEIVVAAVGLGAGVGGYLWLCRRPSRGGCGPSSSGFG